VTGYSLTKMNLPPSVLGTPTAEHSPAGRQVGLSVPQFQGGLKILSSAQTTLESI